VTEPGAEPETDAPSPGFGPTAAKRMAWLLRGGLVLASVLLAAGLVAFMLLHPNEDRRTLVNSNPIVGYLQVRALWAGLEGGHTQAYLTLAVLVLVFTPVARVLLGWYYFHRSGDRVLMWISASVLGLLLLGLFVIGPLVR
jgi:uncharacterized membrane protein